MEAIPVLTYRAVCLITTTIPVLSPYCRPFQQHTRQATQRLCLKIQSTALNKTCALKFTYRVNFKLLTIV